MIYVIACSDDAGRATAIAAFESRADAEEYAETHRICGLRIVAVPFVGDSYAPFEPGVL